MKTKTTNSSEVSKPQQISLKVLINIVLLSFVGISLAFMTVKEVRRSDVEHPDSTSSAQAAQLNDHIRAQQKPALSSPGVLLKDNDQLTKMTVYYFHGNFRCKTCLTVEEMSKSAIKNNFANELNSGSMEWLVINFDEAENKHFIDDFELSGSSLVVAGRGRDKTSVHQTLQDVWFLTDDPGKFEDYVLTEVLKILNRQE